MANLMEIALGLVQVLQLTTEPEPLGVDLRGQSLAETRFLIKRVIDECLDAGVALAKVRASEPVGSFKHRGISVETSSALDHRLEFFRSPQGRTDGSPR